MATIRKMKKWHSGVLENTNPLMWTRKSSLAGCQSSPVDCQTPSTQIANFGISATRRDAAWVQNRITFTNENGAIRSV